MGFTPEQSAQLAAKLAAADVKTREQAGRKLSYIESWHAIAEANRIFGFDGWDSETLDIKCVAEHERQIGSTNPKPGWGVSYTARVRVTAGGITRDGVGAGHGIDRDLGLAHESAIKEAESDARKRALMTFGNPFGLALYDKDQENVERPQGRPQAASAHSPRNDTRAPVKPAPDAPTSVYQPGAGMTAGPPDVERAISHMRGAKTLSALSEWEQKYIIRLEEMSPEDKAKLRKALDQHRINLLPVTAAG